MPVSSLANDSLTDEALGRITAKGSSPSSPAGEYMKFFFESGGVKLDGDLTWQQSPLPDSVGSLTLQGHAQENLQSLISINAVNSNIYLLLNMNVNIDSNIVQLTQTNTLTPHLPEF
jgi:hypothetical protein